MQITVEHLSNITGRSPNANMRSIVAGLNVYGKRAGLDLPHRLAQYLAQLMHESGGTRYDQEIASGRAYEGRADLGNTEPGDGVRFKGRTAGQITGRANYTAFRDWCKNKGLNPPDFVAQPELLNTDPWEGLGFIWFWTTRKLNGYADKNDIEMITRRVNGGLNGYDDRLEWYTKVALVLLGFPADDVKAFQAYAQASGLLPPDTDDAKQVDGIAGPKTRAALHQSLVAAAGKQIAEADIPTKAGPVVEVETAVPKGSDRRGWLYGTGVTGIVGTVWSSFIAGDWQTRAVIGVVVIAVLALLLFFGERIIRRAKRLLSEV